MEEIGIENNGDDVELGKFEKGRRLPNRRRGAAAAVCAQWRAAATFWPACSVSPLPIANPLTNY
jgi:hypothetical protein